MTPQAVWSLPSLIGRPQETQGRCEKEKIGGLINKIVALADIYGADNLARALQDAFDCEAFSSEYVANILEQRQRLSPQPGPLHLTRRADLLDVDLGPADLSPCQP